MHLWHLMTWPTAPCGSNRGGARALASGRLLLSAALLVGMMGAPASAQSASFRSVDRNGDGVLTVDELIATFGRNGANRLLRSTDHNGDGRITLSELRRGPDDDRDDDDRNDDRDEDRDDDRDDGDNDGDDGGGDDGGDDGGEDD